METVKRSVIVSLGRRRDKDLGGSETILYDTFKIGYVIRHLPKPTDYTTQRMNLM